MTWIIEYSVVQNMQGRTGSGQESYIRKGKEIPAANWASEYAHLTMALSVSLSPRLSATLGPKTVAITCTRRNTEPAILEMSDACETCMTHLSVADVQARRAVCTREYANVALQLPQFLRPSAISSETLWCHKFHVSLLGRSHGGENQARFGRLNRRLQHLFFKIHDL